jgi:hypothetical protein
LVAVDSRPGKSEVVPALVDFQAAVPRLRPAVR